MAEYEFNDVDRENERRKTRLETIQAGSGTTRDSAYAQYRDYFDSIGGKWDDGMQHDFDNLWRQSAEASQFGGAGLDQANSFASNFENYKPRLQQRWQGEANQDGAGGPSASMATSQYSGAGGGAGGGLGGTSALQALLTQLQGDRAQQQQERAGLRSILMQQLDAMGQPVSLDQPGLKEVVAGSRIARQRGTEAQRGELAERRAYDGSGGIGSKAFQTDVDRLLQGQGEAQAQYEGGLLNQEMQQRRQQLSELLNRALLLQDSESARNIQAQLAAIDQQLGDSRFYAGLGQNQSQFLDNQAFNYAGLNQNANQAALLALLGAF